METTGTNGGRRKRSQRTRLGNSLAKVLIVPPGIEGGWYMENHAEYLIRYLSDEFFIEIADVPYEPYENFISRFPETSPFQRNPDDFDLVFPLLPSHWVVTDKDKYAHKIATVFYQPREGRYEDVAVVGCTTKFASKSMQGLCKYHNLRFGVDTKHFTVLDRVRTTNKLVVGMVGNIYNPRRMTADIINALEKLEGIEIKLFAVKEPRTEHDMDFIGGMKNMKYIVSGSKSWAGVPNIYNSLDVLIRCDSDPGYSFPTLEAAACGVPVIATDQGIDHIITKAHGGILIKADEVDAGGSGRSWYQANQPLVAERIAEAVMWMRDNSVKRIFMGRDARHEIEDNWTWDKFIPAWREFFREGVANARKGIQPS